MQILFGKKVFFFFILVSLKILSLYYNKVTKHTLIVSLLDILHKFVKSKTKLLWILPLVSIIITKY